MRNEKRVDKDGIGSGEEMEEGEERKAIIITVFNNRKKMISRLQDILFIIILFVCLTPFLICV